MQYIAWLLLMVVVSIFGEILAEVTKVLNAQKEFRPVAVVWFMFLGLICGFVTATVVPERLLPPGPFEGVSVLILPFILGAGLAFVGWVREATRSNFASWYGGAAIGIGLAIGRLIGLAFVADLRSI